MRYRYLSHVMKDEIPAYGDVALLGIDKVKSIAGGDSANVYRFAVGSHHGTHIDAPNHFFEKGKKITDYPAAFWVFKKPVIVDVKLGPSEILKCGEWTKEIDRQADIALFRSGWSLARSEKKYSFENPGIHPEVALHLRKYYPRMRAIGIDWVSVSPYSDRALGRETHRAFLDPEGENAPLCIIEDMDLSGAPERLSEIFAFPLQVSNIDSAPCTIVGGFLD